ncbi:MAG: hypothetical protein L7S58_02895 [Acidimicrobiales bacterium]|nr:hypothetical protein [Acidimicrobiales bacterium]
MKSSSALRSYCIRIVLSTPIILIIAACSTGGMEFTVSDQVLQGNSSELAKEAPSQESIKIDEAKNQPDQTTVENVAPDPQESSPPATQEEQKNTNTELDCSQAGKANVFYWPARSPLGQDQNLMLSDARMGAHLDFDRFVLEFEKNSATGIEGPPESYSIQWLPQPPIQFGSGETIQVNGSAYLEILLHAYGYSRGTSTYEYAGPKKVTARGTTNVIEAIFGGEVEGKMVWAIGANNPAGFRVLSMTDPPRLVIDVCTTAAP